MQYTNNRIYSAGSYARLSKDDFHSMSVRGDQPSPNSYESNSITSQKELIRQYVENKPDIHIVNEYEDDGYTGLNFERPGFKAMLDDIQKGIINCVIVKDFSRLGRDHIETGKYLKKMFPRLNIRFVSINDDYDSLGQMRQSDNIMMPFKNLMNDNYSRDISVKVRSHLEVKQKNGEFTGAFAVYGYKKEWNEKYRCNKLVIDEYASAIVYEMFIMILQGYSLQGIAAYLNEHGILSPLEYKKHTGSRFNTEFKVNAKARWTAVAVRRIVTNEVYTGTLVQGKVEKTNYKVSDRIQKPKEEWRRVPNAHEAIVDKEMFNLVQNILEKDTRRGPGKKNLYPFSGLLQCPDCGQMMVRKTEKHKGKIYVYYVCSTHKRDCNKCSSHRINEEKLKKSVGDILKYHVRLLKELKEILPKVEKHSLFGKRLKKIHNHLDIVEKDKEEKNGLKLALFEDYKKGFLEESDYKDMLQSCTKQIKEAEMQKIRLERQIKELQEKGDIDYSWIENILEFEAEKILDRQYLVTTIKQIQVFSSSCLKIELRQQDEFNGILEYSENNTGYKVAAGNEERRQINWQE